ncbi:MAG TPA: acyl-CoA synthetase [Acidimicrobiales bacterium]|nr:acyl-CoA synthetase [Acidimicrobiales bacterium]
MATVAPPRSFNFADVWEMAADACWDREALVCGEQRRTYGQLEERANRLAHHLRGLGVGPGRHVGLYLENCAEYLEAMLACFKVRAVPINVNHRYVAGELRHLLDDSDSIGVIHGPDHEAVVAEVVPDVLTVRWTLCTGEPFEAALAAASPQRPSADGRSEDDRYVIYTGGTTGLPKGVVWRQGDAFFGCLGGGDPMRLQGEVTSPAELVERIGDGGPTYFTLAPLMHAAAQWTSFMWLFAGGKVILLDGRLDPERVWDTVERERPNMMTVVGDAVVKPLLDAWEAEPGRWDASSLFAISNGGAPMSAGAKARILAAFPTVMVTDGFGSSEAGIQGSSRVTAADVPPSGGTVRFDRGTKPLLVLDDDDRPVTPGSRVVGRIVTGGHLPLGYYKDPEKTAATIVHLDGERWLVTGDLATVAEDGTIELLGRGATSINTGGEKVHPEEVEGVLHNHPAVADVLVVGVPDERWGSAVTAVVQLRPGAALTYDEVYEHCHRHLAGYKAPKHLVLVDQIVRSPAGKADYRWAAEAARRALGVSA